MQPPIPLLSIFERLHDILRLRELVLADGLVYAHDILPDNSASADV